ncbi:MAG: FmdB family zinc ribbon protein [Terracidiphilus sp.]
MPAYEYLCDSCATHFEQRQKMSDAALDACPACGGPVHRLISGGAGAITKGSSSAHGHAHADMPPCAFGGACCGGGACASGMFSEN